MKRLFVIVVCGALASILAHGCEARMQVATERVKEQIDSLLGSMDVKRKAIEISVNGLKEGINSLRKAKIKVQVSNDQIQREARPLEEKMDNTDSALKTLRGHLEASEPVEIAGKTYNQEELKDLADRILRARKVCVGQLDGFHSAETRLDKVASTLERKQLDLQQHLADIEGQLVVIDSNRIALVAMQKSAEAMGDDASLAQNLDHLQKKVNSLYADIEVGLRTEDARWAEDLATTEVDATQSLVAGIQNPRDTIAEIDQILVKKQ
jgi:FtsZ-binding cell division protein ZapB